MMIANVRNDRQAYDVSEVRDIQDRTHHSMFPGEIDVYIPREAISHCLLPRESTGLFSPLLLPPGLKELSSILKQPERACNGYDLHPPGMVLREFPDPDHVEGSTEGSLDRDCRVKTPGRGRST